MKERKKRFECFGDANSSDACLQCLGNDECAEETSRRYENRKLEEGKKGEPAVFPGIFHEEKKGEKKWI